MIVLTLNTQFFSFDISGIPLLPSFQEVVSTVNCKKYIKIFKTRFNKNTLGVMEYWNYWVIKRDIIQ